MKKILVTGGLGFIGSHTIVELFKAGYQPVIVDNLANSEQSVLDRIEKIVDQKVPFYKHDYQDKTKLTKLIKHEAIGGIIHFAAYKAVGESVQNPLKYYQNNVAGLINLLEVCEQTHIESFVFSSSCTIYGEPSKLPVTEMTPIKTATSPYGATKQMDETIVADATKVSRYLRSVLLRYFNPIGAHQSALIGELPKGLPANLVPFITQTVIGWRPELTVFGDNYPTPDGTCIRDYIHVIDLAEAHVKALEYAVAKKPGYCDSFNIGTGQGSSVLEVIKSFESATRQKVNYRIGPRRLGDVVAVYANVDKANQELGWKAKLSLEQALKDAWHWQQTLKQPST